MNTDNSINPGAVDATDFEMADPLMQAMADTGFEGMTAYQRNVVCKMAEMLDAAVKRLDAIGACAGKDTGALVTLASNHALMMRKHGTTLRGAKHAAMLEDLCDAILAAKRPIVVSESAGQQEPVVTAITLPPSGCITVEQAMEALGLKTLTHLAKILGVTSGSISGWRKQGFIHWKQSQVVTELTREVAA